MLSWENTEFWNVIFVGAPVSASSVMLKHQMGIDLFIWCLKESKKTYFSKCQTSLKIAFPVRIRFSVIACCQEENTESTKVFQYAVLLLLDFCFSHWLSMTSWETKISITCIFYQSRLSQNSMNDLFHHSGHAGETGWLWIMFLGSCLTDSASWKAFWVCREHLENSVQNDFIFHLPANLMTWSLDGAHSKPLPCRQLHRSVATG